MDSVVSAGFEVSETESATSLAVHYASRALARPRESLSFKTVCVCEESIGQEHLGPDVSGQDVSRSVYINPAPHLGRELSTLQCRDPVSAMEFRDLASDPRSGSCPRNTLQWVWQLAGQAHFARGASCRTMLFL